MVVRAAKCGQGGQGRHGKHGRHGRQKHYIQLIRDSNFITREEKEAFQGSAHEYKVSLSSQRSTSVLWVEVEGTL